MKVEKKCTRRPARGTAILPPPDGGGIHTQKLREPLLGQAVFDTDLADVDRAHAAVYAKRISTRQVEMHIENMHFAL
ncbi:hypothetical protein [Mesorhizobium sp. RMAD-H1]|uniref:hypothetical protein n=1 Tax=Mesorhizobium sp. RMAD-H1 TaxID=2587065 RepID=UPI001FEFB561|nr:hypothetical protein [Mesorhizobium sp. RMAD-H1]